MYVERVHTRNTPSYLDVTDTVLISAENHLSLPHPSDIGIRERYEEMHTSTKLAVFPSSSTPRVLNRVPARFQPSLDIRDNVATVGEPFVGGAGKAMVNRPT
jgi:hypothetical protein